jgi:hypothetical protein
MAVIVEVTLLPWLTQFYVEAPILLDAVFSTMAVFATPPVDCGPSKAIVSTTMVRFVCYQQWSSADGPITDNDGCC